VLNDDGISAGIRGIVFQAVTNGVVHHGGPPTAQFDGFDTFEGDVSGFLNDFVGLQYGSQARFDTITIEMGNQFVDGGDWEVEPRIFILKNPVDTDTTRPEEDPTNWVEITGFTETTGHVFSSDVVPGSGGTMTFDLAAIPAANRTGYGWAVGGVDGNSNPETLAINFVSVSEISATGSYVGMAHPGDFDSDGDVDGADFVAWQTNFPTATGATLAQGDADGDGDVDGADFVVWQTNFPFTPGPGASPVPEPAAGLLAAIGVAAIVVARRRR
jgi:MYXO-CTERM domain-containing protein